MPAKNNSQLLKGLILLSGMMLIASCAEPPPPYAVVYEEEEAPEEIVVKAQLPEPDPQPEPEPVESIVYEAEYPETYIVQEGDTLWDISTVFLRDPWYWPEIWFKNPQVENPHLIYPGDTLAIVYIGGERRVQILSRGEEGSVLSQTSDGLKIVKVNPRIRSQAIDATVASIPIDSLRHLLERPMVVDEETFKNSAYVLSSLDNHLINSTNDKLYVRKLDTSTGNGRYQIYRPDRPLYDPITDELLGYQALYVGESKLLLRGDPASVRVTNSDREILRDDRVMLAGKLSRCWTRSRKPAFTRPSRSTWANATGSSPATYCGYVVLARWYSTSSRTSRAFSSSSRTNRSAWQWSSARSRK
jgi:hypothetical protein